MLKSLTVALAMTAVAGCATSPPPPVPEAVRAQLAPTGKLRAGMNLGNPLFTTRDPASGQIRGAALDVMRELAARLGVELELVMHATPGDVTDAVDKGTWDVAVIAIEQSRARTLSFSPPM